MRCHCCQNQNRPPANVVTRRIGALREYIKRAERFGFSESQLATRAGYNRYTFSRFKSGQWALYPSTLTKVFKALMDLGFDAMKKRQIDEREWLHTMWGWDWLIIGRYLSQVTRDGDDSALFLFRDMVKAKCTNVEIAEALAKRYSKDDDEVVEEEDEVEETVDEQEEATV